MNVPELFGSMVFNETTMKERLPENTYRALKKTIREGRSLDITVASVVATAMKDWALEKGVTHFTHWFQPMNGVTAEKHDSFISPVGRGGIIMEFSGKELIQGEPDASSFPSGGLRATFEARGYTAWDPTSYAFIKENTLCIPTAFCSYSGEALDKKTPLMRSCECIGKQAIRILRLFGNEDVKKVNTTVGSEQEYFLIDKELFSKREDLVITGRTLFGVKPPKGQELDDHYFGAIKPRVKKFMKDLNEELWKLGIYSKTEHNEVAPAQHELAPVYADTNMATDHNQLTMEMMKKVADRHGLACLLHEKPFEGVNGSGKHNNWSLSTDTGVNLLEPGNSPHENAQFLLFLTAVIKAVDKYQDLLRFSVATAGNDHRLGANEAPPAIISMFLGDELTKVLKAIEEDTEYDKGEDKLVRIGVHVLPKLPKDTTDRNRTSPFAFTGNKFEFRMPGSSSSVADPNTIINTAVAEVLSEFADRLENSDNLNKDMHNLIRETISNHKRIIFNGNNYCDEWTKEAEKRGLLNLKATADVLPCLIAKKNVDMFVKQKVFTEKEVHSRYEVVTESYCKVLGIEALTMLDMARKEIIPAVCKYQKELADTFVSKKNTGLNLPCVLEEKLVTRLAQLSALLDEKLAHLETSVAESRGISNFEDAAQFCKNVILPAMGELRTIADEIEEKMAKECIPYPTYRDLLFSV